MFVYRGLTAYECVLPAIHLWFKRHGRKRPVFGICELMSESLFSMFFVNKFNIQSWNTFTLKAITVFQFIVND
jgi:hypothetical protein